MPEMSIGQLAKRATVPVDTVRYYERSGLLAPAHRNAAGYRHYGDVELRRLRFIRRAKALGFGYPESGVGLGFWRGVTHTSRTGF